MSDMQQTDARVEPVPRPALRAGLALDARWIVTLVTILLFAIGIATFIFGRWTVRNETAPAPPPPSGALPVAPGPDNTITTMPPPPPAGIPSPAKPEENG